MCSMQELTEISRNQKKQEARKITNQKKKLCVLMKQVYTSISSPYHTIRAGILRNFTNYSIKCTNNHTV